MIELKDNSSYNIIIVGVGGTGSHLTSFLSQLIGNNKVYNMKHKIILVDGDVVEEKNLKTQKFLESDVGRLKSEVLSERYSSVFGMEISYVDKYISSKEDVLKLLDRSYGTTNVIVSCVDNNEARKYIDQAFNEFKFNNHNCPGLIAIDTGNSGSLDELTGQTVVAYRTCDEVILPSASSYFPQILKEEEKKEPTASCGEIMLENIQNIGANITSAVTTFNILNNIIGFNKITGDLHMFNATTIETESLKVNIA